MTNRSDTIEVRADEQLNQSKLEQFLADKRSILGVDEGPFTIRQFGGGMANLTYELDFGEKQFVLRRPPLGPIAKSAHDMGREYSVLSRLYQRFSLAPRAYIYCEDEAIIGAPFFIMERRYGTVVRGKIPSHYLADPDTPRKMSIALIDALADFHAVDYEAIGLGELGKPAGFVSRQIEGWYKRWHRAKAEEIPVMDEVYEWLKAHYQESPYTSLIHNDYKLDNVMLDNEDPGRMVAIFDWDMCTLGDPLCDVGALLTYWTDPNDPPYMRMLATRFLPVGDYSFLSREDLIERYIARSGRPIDNIHFYHALGMYRLTVIIAQIYIRYKRGQTQDQRFAALGEIIPLLAQAARDIAYQKA